MNTLGYILTPGMIVNAIRGHTTILAKVVNRCKGADSHLTKLEQKDGTTCKIVNILISPATPEEIRAFNKRRA